MQLSHITVPLKTLRHGHEAPNHPGNARVTGREDGIAQLAAHIHARGKIDDLLVYDDGVPDVLFVANGNRSLKALRMIYGDDSSEPIDCKLTTAERAYEDSLAVSVLAKKFHPVDEYEAFSKLRDDHGKSEEDIARQYGMTPRQVEQVLALGHLSSAVRMAWRQGLITSSAATAFTLADHKRQDEVLKQLCDEDRHYSVIDDSDVKEALDVRGDAGALVEFVGIEAYVAKGGKVTRDLFGVDHQVSNVKLAKKLADEKLAEECKALKAAGWGFAMPHPNNAWNYGKLGAEGKPTEEEQVCLDELAGIIARDRGRGQYALPQYHELSAEGQKAFLALRGLKHVVQLRAYTPAMMAKAGCFLQVDDSGLLEIEYGRVKPAQKEKAAEVEKAERKEQKKAEVKAAKEEGKLPPEPKALSNAQTERLESQLTAATRDAIAADPLLAQSPFAEVLAKIVCAQIVPESRYRTPDAVRTKLPTIRQALDAEVFNAALARRYDDKDYFSSAPKGFVLKAIAEAINQDEARKIAGKTKPEIWKFALANVSKTGWLPKELRTVHYKGPGSEGYKPPTGAIVTATGAAPSSSPAPAQRSAPAKPKPSAKAKPAPVKRAAAAKKPAKKTAKKKK
ncbi:putative plasmid stabilization protein [Bradyrhizobium sp.]|uniref:ParB/RepB/Spo0J family partition protein n=1 Tax=Bradyrhizobium sp. TaxID=376 RepID=UPI0007C1BE33|nr:hypothetical protein [Bradyrhizobium sp.]CUT12516.1 putative plasmid stabilization protein [Bradyrhizobium sp.]